jgi:integrase
MKPFHEFSSILAPAISSYLAIKKALGRRFNSETAILRHLDRFLVEQPIATTSLASSVFAEWCLTFLHLTPTVRRNWMRIVRNLCLYMRRSEPGCFVPDPAGFPAPHEPRRPHIFTEEQVLRLLKETSKAKARSNAPLHAEGLRLAIVLLYTTGLRRGELVRLTVSDYDPVEKTLFVRVSKFYKPRLIALSNDAASEIEVYLKA